MHIFGANNFGKEMIEYFDFNRYKLTEIFDFKGGIELKDFTFSVKYNSMDSDREGLIITVKDNRERKRIAQGMRYMFWSFVDKSARRGYWSEIKLGDIILQDVVICPGAKIGWHTILNKNAYIGVDSVIGDFVNIGQNVVIEDNVTIGEGVNIGPNSVVKSGVTIGCWADIPGCTLVKNDIQDFPESR